MLGHPFVCRLPAYDAMTAAPMTIHLFGPMRVRIQGEPMPRVRARSAEWLLALLVLRHGRTVQRSWLAGTLWPDSEETQALQNLRHALLSLRKALGPQSERLLSPTRDTLTLDLSDIETDVLRFDQAMRKGEEAALRSAVEVYTGPLLEGCFEEWVVAERASREQACLRALETLADAAEKRRDYAEALGWLHRAQGMDALRDTTRRALMRVLSASGDAPTALSSYRDYRILLREEMNVEPDEETVGLYQQIRQKAQQGAHRRGSTTPETRPSPASSPVTQPLPAALPHPLTTLLGREQETHDIAEALSRSRLVTLVGGGGVGKTRLAIQVARQLASDLARKAAFVELAALSDPTLLPAFVAAALGIREEATAEPEALLQALTGWLCTHPVLLVLDNCEHLVEATASLTQTLLDCCPALCILTTSRQRLGLTGEVVWRVPSLSYPDPERLSKGGQISAETALEYPAVQLFVERAAMARPGFRLAATDDAMAVARICQRLDGIPLAIELAAARVGILSVGQIASRLSDRFHLLTGGSRTALPRQQTLRALIAWSYDLLTDEERTRLCQLSVFAGGWTLQAVEAVTGSGKSSSHTLAPGHFDTLDILTALVDKSLVLSEEGQADIRYRMLETVREYAGEKLRESVTESVTRDRHLAYFLEQAQASALTLAGSDPEPALVFLETEVDNIRAALAWAQAHAPTSESYLQLVAALWPFWELRGYLTEGRAHLRTALSLTAASDTPTRAQALLGATRLAVSQSDIDAALAFGQECLERFRALENTRGMAEALHYLSEAHLIRQDVMRAVPLLTEALDRSRQSAWLPGTILVTMLLGTVHIARREMRQGRSFLEEALALAEALGDPRLLARAYGGLGRLEITEGNHARARTLLEKDLEIRIRLGDRMGIAYTLGSLGDLEKHGDMARAIHYCQEEMAIYRELGNVAELAHALHRMGNLHYRQGDYEPARQAYSEALELIRSIGSEVGFAYVRMNLGSTLFHLGDAAAAKQLYREALPLYVKALNEEGIVWALERLGIVEARQGDVRKAARLLGAASRLREGRDIPLASFNKQDWDSALATLRATLGETAFAEAFEAGRALSCEQAVEQAMIGAAFAGEGSGLSTLCTPSV
jgi:predicted ATPase/DNA-binding SARP family transcriptional activator